MIISPQLFHNTGEFQMKKALSELFRNELLPPKAVIMVAIIGITATITIPAFNDYHEDMVDDDKLNGSHKALRAYKRYQDALRNTPKPLYYKDDRVKNICYSWVPGTGNHNPVPCEQVHHLLEDITLR